MFRKYFIILTVYLIGLASLAIIVAWIFDITVVLSILPGFITIKFSTALAFFLSSLILYFAYYSPQGRFANLNLIIVSFSILIIWIMMITILVSIIFGFKSGIENLFIIDTTIATNPYVPGRPSLGTIVAFLLITILGLNIFYEGKWKNQLFLFLGSLVFLIGAVSKIGLILAVPVLYYDVPSISNAISIPASILFMFIGLAFSLLYKINPKRQA
ncbi:MAG: hypothetical protein Q7K65_00475 [Candidatus Buchananbacteria bacterium]|nr:hypothetical protein [Candidatus Buchananbacteria bacterium]